MRSAMLPEQVRKPNVDKGSTDLVHRECERLGSGGLSSTVGIFQRCLDRVSVDEMHRTAQIDDRRSQLIRNADVACLDKVV